MSPSSPHPAPEKSNGRGMGPASLSDTTGTATKRRSALRRFLVYVKPYRWLVASAAFMGILKFCLPLLFPLVLKFITDDLLGAHPGSTDAISRVMREYAQWLISHLPFLGDGRFGMLNAVALTMFLIYVLLSIATYYRSMMAGRVGQRMIFDMRYDMYQHLQRMSHSFYSNQKSGSIVSRFMSDIALAQNFVGSALTNVWMDGASLFFVVYILFYLEPSLAWISLAAMPFYVFVIRYMSPLIKKSSRRSQEKLEEMSGDLQEKIAGMTVVKAFVQERREARRFFKTSHELTDMFLRNIRLGAFNQMYTGFLTTAAPLIVVWIAAFFVLREQMSVGTMIAFYGYLGSLYLPLQRFSELGLVVSNSMAAIERIFELMDVMPEVREKPDAMGLPPARGHIRFAQVSFSYDSKLATLFDLNFEIKPGEVVALVGQSGSGKSSLVGLIPRFYDVTTGQVLIDGHDVRDLTFKSLRGQIGMVLQETVLFSATLRENLLYGNPRASDAELHQAAQMANTMEFIERLPNNFETPIGERGIKLSGGQRQRIAIARAFLKNPRILILDEATSALDSESEHLIQDALWRLMKGRTTIIIAHRLSTIIHTDRIFVMHEGRIVETGRHADLFAAGGQYTRLARKQFRDTIAPMAEMAAN
jgi:subfamily B ATP-binding cassette protein MsbA